MGIALLGSLATVVYRGQLADAAFPFLGEDASQTARYTLGGAVAVALHLPADAADAVLTAARDAFVVGFQLVAGVGAVIIALLAVIAARYIRG